MSQNYVQKATGASPSGLTDSQLFDDGTNVGIGTTTPAAELHVVGGLSTTTAFRVQGTAAASTSGNGAQPTETVVLVGTAGQATTGTTGQTGGQGAHIDIRAGQGGSAPAGSSNGSGGDLILRAGQPGAGAGNPGSMGQIVCEGVLMHVAADPGSALLELGVNNLGTDGGFWVFGATNANTGGGDGAGKLLIQDGHAGATRMTFDTEGRVGIGTTGPTALLDINSDTLRLRTARTPASASAAGNQGDIAWDSNYLYICVAANTWRRAAHSSW